MPLLRFPQRLWSAVPGDEPPSMMSEISWRPRGSALWAPWAGSSPLTGDVAVPEDQEFLIEIDIDVAEHWLACIEPVRGPALWGIRLEMGTTTNAHLAQLAERASSWFPALRFLSLYYDQFTAAGYGSIATLASLRYIDLCGSAINRAGLFMLSRLPDLESLDMSGIRIGDEAIPVLATMTALRSLNCERTQISELGMALLARVLPNCTLYGPRDGEERKGDGPVVRRELYD